jgi:hypothetical protein
LELGVWGLVLWCALYSIEASEEPIFIAVIFLDRLGPSGPGHSLPAGQHSAPLAAADDRFLLRMCDVRGMKISG